VTARDLRLRSFPQSFGLQQTTIPCQSQDHTPPTTCCHPHPPTSRRACSSNHISSGSQPSGILSSPHSVSSANPNHPNIQTYRGQSRPADPSRRKGPQRRRHWVPARTHAVLGGNSHARLSRNWGVTCATGAGARVGCLTDRCRAKALAFTYTSRQLEGGAAVSAESCAVLTVFQAYPAFQKRSHVIAKVRGVYAHLTAR
jgi:hypothetical protein